MLNCDCNTWNHLTVEKRAQAHLKMLSTNHLYKEVLALNNLQWLICYKTKPNIFIELQNTYKLVLSLKNVISDITVGTSITFMLSI